MRRTQNSKSPAEELDVGDEGQVQRRTSRAKLLAEQRLNGLRLVLQNPDSRAWLWGMLASAGIFSECFTGNSETFFNEGKRSVGLRVFAEVMANFPEQYLAMAREGEGNV